MTNSEFKKAARLHQVKYRQDNISPDYNTYETWMPDDAGKSGKNFYTGFSIFSSVQKRYPDFYVDLYSDMLRSEHIPFNFFVPFKYDLIFCKNVFNELLGDCIKSIDIKSVIDNKDNIKIEFAPSPKENYLDDRTSFDTYIEYNHIDDKKGIIGIEVKYTERDYKLVAGSTQEKTITNTASKYYTVSNDSKIYKPNSIEDLRTDLFRQIWRNQLLGESMLLTDNDKFKHSSSLVFFPEGNDHFISTSKKYIAMLTDNKNKFFAITYETFLSSCNKHCPNDEYKNWIDYLTKRYIFAAT